MKEPIMSARSLSADTISPSTRALERHLSVAGATARPQRPRSVRPAIPASPPSHLTRRGRVALVALIVAVLFGAFSLGRSAAEAAPEPQASQAAPTVQLTTVQPGESLWTLAKRIAPDNDTRDVVAQIRRLNDLTTSQLQVGQQLVLPVAA
jgi:LysM repeat protein